MASFLGLGTAVVNGWVALRRTQSDKNALAAVAESKTALEGSTTMLEQGVLQLSGAVDRVTANLSERFDQAQKQMDRMLDLLAQMVAKLIR